MGYITTYVPADPGKAPTAGTPGTAASLTSDFNLGWNSGAVSVDALSGDGTFQFSVLGSVQGIVAGLSDANFGEGYAAIRYGFYLSSGKAQVYEYGVAKSAATVYSDGAVFTVQRRGPTISYYIDGDLLYTSSQLSDGLLLGDVSIYAGGDSITGAVFTTEVFGTAGSEASMESLTSVGYAGNYAQSAVSLLPIETSAHGGTIASSASAMLPLVSIGSNYAYTSSSASMQPIAGSASTGALAPGYNVSAASFAYQLSAGHGLTGETGGAETELAPLQALAADHAYAASTATMEAIEGVAYQAARINAYALLNMPKPFNLTASGTRQTPNTFSGHLKHDLIANFGGFAKLKAKPGSLLATGTGVVIGRAYLHAPAGKLTASGTAGSIGAARLTLPARPKISAYSGAVLSVRIGGKTHLTASGTQGGIGRAVMRLPLCRLVASGAPATYGVARLTAPKLRAAPNGRAFLISPRARLVAYGSAVVAVEYEAYAINLKPGAETPNQVTHYTDFPFNQIVRFNNAYYGVAADGLYLLEGDTDAGAPIAWNWQSALSDFESRHFKRAVSAYIGGRLGDETELRVIVGEQSESDYAYAAVRGSNAQTYRSKFGRGLKSRYYAIGMQDQNGSAVEIDTIELEIEELTRSI